MLIYNCWECCSSSIALRTFHCWTLESGARRSRNKNTSKVWLALSFLWWCVVNISQAGGISLYCTGLNSPKTWLCWNSKLTSSFRCRLPASGSCAYINKLSMFQPTFAVLRKIPMDFTPMNYRHNRRPPPPNPSAPSVTHIATRQTATVAIHS